MFKVGDEVTLIEKFEGEPGWVDRLMGRYFNEKGEVTSIDQHLLCVRVDFGNSTYLYPETALMLWEEWEALKEKFPIGTEIVIARKIMGAGAWVDPMDKTVGMKGTVRSDVHQDRMRVVLENGVYWWYPILSLDLLKKDTSPIKEGDKVKVYRKIDWKGWNDKFMKVGAVHTIKEIAIDDKDDKKYALMEDGLYYPWSCLKKM